MLRVIPEILHAAGVSFAFAIRSIHGPHLEKTPPQAALTSAYGRFASQTTHLNMFVEIDNSHPLGSLYRPVLAAFLQLQSFRVYTFPVWPVITIVFATAKLSSSQAVIECVNDRFKSLYLLINAHNLKKGQFFCSVYFGAVS
ncbi:MAG: hypothetical protein ACSLEN_12695 [Candidatus Malihini olakiniferum]